MEEERHDWASTCELRENRGLVCLIPPSCLTPCTGRGVSSKRMSVEWRGAAFSLSPAPQTVCVVDLGWSSVSGTQYVT